MKTIDLPWPGNTQEAIVLQRELSQKLILKGDASGAELIAGVDCSSYGNTGVMVGAVVVWSRSENRIVDTSTASREADFPYIPGLLAFREIPVLLDAFRKLKTVPDAVICDGQGLAHMRHFGIACHLGLYLDIPTVGCGKTRLVGTFEMPGKKKGSFSSLYYKGELVGKVVRTRDGVNPVFISPGNRIGFNDSVNLVLNSCTRYRLPEPIRAAHKLAGKTIKAL